MKARTQVFLKNLGSDPWNSIFKAKRSSHVCGHEPYSGQS
jgi:hypothetical protein